MLDHYYAIVMAGGGGTRLWPLSRQARPKQMLPLIDENSLFQSAVMRLEDLFPMDHVLVVTVQTQADQLQEQCPGIPPENYLIEPMPRGTASVVGLAAIALQHRDPQATMAILASDHHISNLQKFHQILLAGYELAQEGHLVTMGITPTYPATGFGYIQSGEYIGRFNDLDALRVLHFKEKPDTETARQFLKTGDHTWNSGMFIWRVKDILDEFHRQMPDLAEKLDVISQAWDTPGRESVLQNIWPQIHVDTIDYGIMEGARDVAVIPAEDLGWSDVGSWESLYDVKTPDENGNIVIEAEHIGLETQNTLVFADRTKRLVVTIGVNDLVIVDTGDVLLVCHREHAQKVRQIVSQLKQDKPSYL